MLLRITEKCHGKCTHCFVNAMPEGQHMSMNTFYKSMDFIEKQNPMCLLISGGEPTEHPNICHMIEEAKKRRIYDITILSNGHFLYSEELTEKILRLGVRIQITYDKRYYAVPIPQDRLNHPLIIFEDEVKYLYPLGRAKINRLECNSKTPKCFNLRSLCGNQATSLKEAIKTLESYLRFCTPSINIDGSISAGESNLCYKIGNITMDEDILLQNIKTMKCNRCGLEEKLAQQYKAAIGLF